MWGVASDVTVADELSTDDTRRIQWLRHFVFDEEI